MSSSAVKGRADAPSQGLAPGSVVGGRFEIERAVGEDALGSLLAAKDQKTTRPIAVRVLRPGLIATPAAMEVLRAEIKIAATIQHKSIVATYGMGTDKGGARFVATEWVDGRTLSDVVREKKQEGATPMSLRGAYNVLAHVCKGLEAAQKAGASHGAIRPSVVWITKAGRVKVANIGIERAIVRTAGPAALGADELAFLAPEVKVGGTPDERSDVFGIGCLLYAMLTGRSAADDFVAPSSMHPEATPEVDDLLLRCLSADPAARFASPTEVQEALVALAVETKAEEHGDFGVDIDVDVDIGAAAKAPPQAPTGVRPKPPPPKPAAPAAKAPPKPAAPAVAAKPAGPQIGARVGADQSFRAPVPFDAAPAASADVDLGALVAKITENDAARWMVVKDGLDHGPFSGREMVQLILKGEILGDHGLLNMDSGQRRKVREQPEFVEFLEQFRIKKAAQEHQVAEVKAEKRAKLGAVFYIAVLAGVLAVLGIGLGIFFATREDEQEVVHQDVSIEDLYARGEIQIEGQAGILPDPPRRTGGGHRRTGGAGGMSYEDAMNQVQNLGDATQGGSEARLSAPQVQGVMNQNVNRFLPCVAREPNIGTVRMSIAIAGSGQVLGATVNGSPAFQSCINQRIRGIRFPSFPAARMGASYSFSVD
jgi:hypothetical protein